MSFTQFDWLVIGIATVLNMLIGFVWYSKWLFGPIWMKLSKLEVRHGIKSFIMESVVSLTLAFFLFMFESALQVTTVTDGMIVGFLFWLGFVATTQISLSIWNKKSMQLFLIDSGYRLLSFLVMSGLMGA